MKRQGVRVFKDAFSRHGDGKGGVMPDIKDMQLYPAPERILTELAARGFGEGPIPVQEVAALDQLHYHGSSAVDLAIERLGIGSRDRVLEVGSGWGGPSRWIAHRSGAQVEAVELQADYDSVARELTDRTGLADHVTHICGDFLDVPLSAQYDHIVSWLALYHIPDRGRYLGRIREMLMPGGGLWIEDLTLAKPVPDGEWDRFASAMFPNSIVGLEDYGSGLEGAGFKSVVVEDMTEDWAKFVAQRLAAFRGIKEAYEAVHGADGFAALEAFYAAVSGYFEDGILAGVRVLAK